MRALSLPGCACRGVFQFAALARLAARGERFDLVAGASSGSLSGAAWVAGLADQGPEFVRAMMSTPIFGARYLRREKSLFGMGAIVRDLLERWVPEPMLVGTEAEFLVATTHAGRYARGLVNRRPGWEREGLVVHSNRTRRASMHEVILASCYIPFLYAGIARVDGEVHIDGGAADNNLVEALIERGATDITIVTPYPDGGVSRTVFAPEVTPTARPDARLRLVFPERRLSLGRFDFSPSGFEEALTMPQIERVIEPASAREERVA